MAVCRNLKSRLTIAKAFDAEALDAKVLKALGSHSSLIFLENNRSF